MSEAGFSAGAPTRVGTAVSEAGFSAGAPTRVGMAVSEAGFSAGAPTRVGMAVSEAGFNIATCDRAERGGGGRPTSLSENTAQADELDALIWPP